MKKTAVYLITGFLGSGKTTFLKQVIDSFPDNKKLAIIQNEFAPANIDGAELCRTTDKNFELLEINNGSVFCVCLLSGFITSLNDFVTQHQPDLLLLEASGLADPISVSEMFHAPVFIDKLYLAGSICIIDALNFLKQDKLIQRIRHQVKIADVVLINKTDLNPNLEAIQVMVNEINPFAQIKSATHCNVPIEELFNTLAKPFQKQNNADSIRSGRRPDINSAVLRSTRPLNHSRAELFLKQLSNISYRVKGYILLDNGKNIAIQAVFKNYKMQEITNPMGYDVDVKKLKELYDKYK